MLNILLKFDTYKDTANTSMRNQWQKFTEYYKLFSEDKGEYITQIYDSNTFVLVIINNHQDSCKYISVELMLNAFKNKQK